MSETGWHIAFTGPEHVVVEEFSVYEPEDYQVLVRTERSLVSAGTELSNLLGQLSAFPGFPCYPGYSNVGVVTAVGSRVEEPKVGQRVVSMGKHASHVLLDLSPNRPGGPQYWDIVPDSVSSEAAAFAILGSVALHGVRRAHLQIGESVLVVGAGVVGQLITQFVLWSGCQPIITTDLYDERLGQARQSGADFTINPQKEEDFLESIANLTEGRGIDVVFEATRSSQTLPLMMKAAAQSGRLMVIGSLPNTVEIDPFTELQLKELHMMGCFQPAAPIQSHAYYPWTQHRNRRTFLNMLGAGKLRVDHLITHRMPYTSAPEAYSMIQSGGGNWLGVAFEWD